MADPEKLYMQSPLVQWVETFKANDGHPLEYQDLYDGVFLNDVMQQIDPRQAYDSVNRCVEDVTVRLHNWDILVKNIKGYYWDVLQQLLVMRLPNFGAICREPLKESSFGEVRKAILLVLGCAVQCEQKEAFIDKIMAMDIGAQTEIVENIKEVTDDSTSILSTQRPESPQGVSSYVDKMFHHLQRLIQERDDCVEMAYDMRQERDFYQTQVEGKPVIDPPQLLSPEKHHMALELAECKAKLRHLRQELELYQEQLSDASDELKESTANCCQLKNENASLLQEARATRSLRDELDILKEKTVKVDMFEKEILKYKEKLNELEFYKARTEELKEDNSILEETKAMLEDQLSNSRKRIETVVVMETELSRYRQQMEEITRDREIEREKLEYLTEENARLEFEKKSSMNESASLESELSAARSRIGNMGGSLSDQLSETSHARILRLELENQRLSSKLAEMKEESLIQSAEISLELEKENQRLTKRVEKLQTSACDSSEQVVQLESEMTTIREEKERLVKALDAVKENSDRQVRELERENEQLAQTLDSIRARSEKTNDVKVKDLERENRILHETVSSKNTQLSKLEFDTRQMQRSVHQLQENVERVQSLEEESQKLEKENAELHTKVSALQHTAEKLETIEQENSDLAVEGRKLQKTVESLQAVNQRREQLENDHISLKVEHQRLQRTLDTLKVESERAVELESEKEDIRKEMQHLQKSLEGQKTQKLKQEQMEFEVIDLGHENQRIQKSLDVTTRRLQQLEQDNNDLEMEGEKMTKELDSLRLTAKRMEDKEKELTQLETDFNSLQRDKSSLEKENRKLKQSAELKDSSLEELNAKFFSLDQESKSLRQSVDKMKEACTRVKELEKENKELLQDLNTDRRTLATLREELVSEKIKAQESINQMEQLKSELERVGINTEKIQMAEQVNDANRYKALETMIEETLKKSNELKEEKIQALESRLEESRKRNTRQQEDLRVARSEIEVLKQRMEEDNDVMKASSQAVVGAAVGRERERLTMAANTSSSHTSKEIQELKDRRIELERMNATLLAENKNMSSSNEVLTKQCNDLEAQLTQLLSQNSSLQGNNSSLQERVAKLQVENTTLQSQSMSAVAQQDMLKEHITRLESDHESLGQSHDSLKSTHHSLVLDHESLQRLHEQLTSDYEKLLMEHSSQKSLQKSLKAELKDLQEQLDSLLLGKDDVNKLRDTLEREKDQLKRELQALGNLQTDYNRLKEDHDQMGKAYDKLSQDYSDVIASHKQIKTDYNSLQRKATEQHGNITEAKENLSVADMEFQKLENKIEAMYQINERLENENQAFLLQIQQLLNQNQELLTKALNSKDHFAEEEKAYMEKLSDLRRQKERLEEKIMEHYKNRISPKKKGLGALIARKAKGIISRAPRRSKSRNNLNENQDNTSQDSGPAEVIGDTGRKAARRKSGDGFNQSGSSPKLASQNRSLAKSYTALHTPLFENEMSPMRGAKSTEDLNDGIAVDSNHLPGIVKPYNMDEDESPRGRRATTPGLSGRRTPGRSSPGSEMLTLDQFLKEANKSPRNGNDNRNDEATDENRRRSHDSESRSSDNSNNSGNRLQQQSHLRHPGLNSSTSTTAGNEGSHFRPDVPDVAASSFMLSPTSVRDISTSRISRLSAGSGNDNSSLGSTGALAGGSDMFTSTPKTEQEPSVILRQQQSSFDSGISPASRSTDHGEGSHSRYLAHKRLSGEDWRSSSQESSPYTSSSRVNALTNNSTNQPHSSSSPRASSSLTSSNNSLNQQSIPSNSSHSIHHQSPSNHANLNNNNSNAMQQPPPIPTEPPLPITATERLDRLTMSSTVPTRDGHYDQPIPSVRNNVDRFNSLIGGRPQHSGHAVNTSDVSLSQQRPGSRGPPDMDRRRSQGAVERVPNHFQPPIPRSQPGALSNKQHSLDNSVVSGHNPGRPPANAMSFQNNPQQRARPASVMGQSVHVRGVISRPPGGERRQQPQGQGGGNNSAILRRASNPLDISQSSSAERPKSVPPHLFNKTDEASARTGGNVIRREIPVPPPRRNRELRDDTDNVQGREAPDGKELVPDGPPVPRQPTPVTLIREPSRRGSRPPDPSSVQRPASSSHPHQPPPPHQQNYNSNNPSLINSRQSSSSSLPSQHQPAYPTASSNQKQIRPDSLPLRGSNGPQQGYNDGAGSIRPMSSAMPRSQSSMGNPISHSNQQQQHSVQRSTTPGPHPNRRNFPDPQSYNNSGGSLPGQDPSTHSNYGHPNRDPHSSSQGQAHDPRQLRGGSEPRDLALSSRPTSSVHPSRNSNQNDPYASHGSHPPPPNPSRSHSQGPPVNRSHPGPYSGQPPQSQQYHHPTSSSSNSSNGPLSPQGSASSHYNNTQPKSSYHYHNNIGGNPSSSAPHSIPPQIRSQGKPLPPSNFHPDSNSYASNSRQSSNPGSTMRSPGEVMAQDRGAMGLPSTLSDTGSLPNQMKPSLQQQQQREDGEGAPPPKGANSIWYEYGCV